MARPRPAITESYYLPADFRRRTLALYSQAFYYVDLLHGLFGYPSKFRRALKGAGALVAAVATDAIGTVVPFVGTMTTVVELMEPRFDRATKKMSEARTAMERLFQFDSGLTELLGYASWVEETTRLAELSLENVRTSFAAAADFINGTLDP